MVMQQARQVENTIRDVIGGVSLPESVVDYRLHFDNDSTGEPAVYVYFLLSSRLTERDFLEEAHRVRGMVMDPLWNSGTGLNPYVRFRGEQEQEELDREERKAKRQ